MHDLPPRRWNPGYIAMRWRHLFWSLPLLGLLAGLVVYFLPMIRNTATGIVQLRPIRTSASGLPLHVAHAIESDKVLWDTILKLDLPGRWSLKGGECVAELRDAIHCYDIRGTSLVEISVSGRSRAESELIWDALVTALKDHLKSTQSLDDQTNLARLEAEVEILKARVEAERRRLAKIPESYHDLLFRKKPATDPVISEYLPPSNETKEFDSAVARLETGMIAFLTEEILCKLRESPLHVYEAPGTPAPANLWEALRPPAVYSSIGLGAGMVLALILAYLLELLIPRKIGGESASAA